MGPPRWTLADADVLRALELQAAGVRRHQRLLQLLPQLDALDVARIFGAKFAPQVRNVIDRHPEWRAAHPAVVRSFEERTAGGDSESDGSGELVNAYEAKRLQRIRENQHMLAALGIQKLAPKRASVKRVAETADAGEGGEQLPLRRSRRISEAAKLSGASRSLTREEQEALLGIPPQGTRRSQRLRGSTTTPPYQELDVPVVDLSAGAADAVASASAEENATPVAGAKRQRVSSQQLAIDLASFHSRWLGNQIWPKGKQTVMQGACPRHTPLFSRMSGVQAWRNAVLLFVNVQGESLYDNVFHQAELRASDDASPATSAVYFQWFAQQRQHVESPVVKRLLRAQKGDARLRVEDASYYLEEPPSAPEPVLLFIRHVDGPYIYCGRLGLLGFRSGSSPLEFRWQLLDVAALAWDKIKTLVESSGERVDGAAVEEQE